MAKVVALVTGASSGLGVEFVRQLDQEKGLDELWITARREERLQELARTCHHPVRIFAGDIRSAIFREQLRASFEKEQPMLAYLVNSAGLGYSGPYLEQTAEQDQEAIEVNILALTSLCRLLIPYMMENAANTTGKVGEIEPASKARPAVEPSVAPPTENAASTASKTELTDEQRPYIREGSHILNIASVAAFLPQPNFSLYAASKAYVLSFSRALHRELRDKKISVTAVCPNPVATEFLEKSGASRQGSSIKKLGMEDKEKVVRQALKRAKKNKDLSLSHPTAYLIYFFSHILPPSFILWLESVLGLY